MVLSRGQTQVVSISIHHHLLIMKVHHIMVSVGWAHVVCALYIPEASFGNNTTMEPIIVTKIPKDRFSKVMCVLLCACYTLNLNNNCENVLTCLHKIVDYVIL